MDESAVPAALAAKIGSDFSTLRHQRRRRLGLFCVAALGGTLGFGLARGLNAPGTAHWLFWVCLAAFAGAGVGLCAFAFGWRLPARRLLRPLPWVGVVAGWVGLALTIRPELDPAPFFKGVACLSLGTGFTAVLLILALFLGRRFLRRHGPTGALLGVGVGLFAIMPLHMVCEHTAADHLMVWHALVPILGGLAGALAWLFLAPREDASEV